MIILVTVWKLVRFNEQKVLLPQAQFHVEDKDNQAAKRNENLQ
jgi:hypothetical protein